MCKKKSVTNISVEFFTFFQSGFTLTEMMISLFLGSLLITGFTQLFLNIKQYKEYHNGIVRIQENIQIASFLLGNHVRAAGHFGCESLNVSRAVRTHHHIDSLQVENDRLFPIEIGRSVFSDDVTQFPLHIIQRYKQDTDYIWSKSVKKFFPLASYSQGFGGKVTVVGNAHFKQDDVLFIADCQHIDVARVIKDTRFNNQKMTSDVFLNFGNQPKQHLAKLYSPRGEVGKYTSEILYIGDTRRTNFQGVPIYALFSTDLNGRTLELIEGVENMRISGCCDSSMKRCFTADDWQRQCPIELIKIDLLMTSVDNALFQPTYFKDITINRHDKIMRKWWSGQWHIRSKK